MGQFLDLCMELWKTEEKLETVCKGRQEKGKQQGRGCLLLQIVRKGRQEKGKQQGRGCLSLRTMYKGRQG